MEYNTEGVRGLSNTRMQKVEGGGGEVTCALSWTVVRESWKRIASSEAVCS